MARNQDAFCCFSSPEPSDGGGFPFLRQAVPQKRFMAQGHEDLKMLQAPPVGGVCPSPSRVIVTRRVEYRVDTQL